MSIETTLKINDLIEVYGVMLNANQLNVMTDYFIYDNTLSEIADNLGITRQAVSDLITRVVKILENFENKLKLVEKNLKINSIVDNLLKNETDNFKIHNLNKIKSLSE